MPTRPTFVPTDPTQLIHQVAMPLIATKADGDEFVGGTAFLIAPGIAITAFHVFDEFVRRYQAGAVPQDGSPMAFHVLTYVTLNGGRHVLPLTIMRMWRAAPLDVAILAVDISGEGLPGHRWTFPRVSMLPPRVGAPIVAFGFTAGRVDSEPVAMTPSLTIGAHTATGKVVEIHHEFRDRAMLPFPCFRTNARFDSGMSGGPVFDNSTGHLCGVVCSSIDGQSDDEGHVSYVSSLWPLVATQIDSFETPWNVGPTVPALRLFEKGICNASDLNRVRVVTLPEGGLQPQANYDARDWDGAAAG
jgi:hypothetical protein